MIDSNLLQGLPAETLLTTLPGLDKLLFEHGQIKAFKSGEILEYSGSDLNYLYIPIDGDLILFNHNNESKEEVLGFLRRGRSLALSHLLFDNPLVYNAKFETDTSIICLEKVVFLNFLKEKDFYWSYLRNMTTSSGVRSLKRYLIEHGLNQLDTIKIIAQVEREDNADIDYLNTLLNSCLILISNGSCEIKFEQRHLSIVVEEESFFGGEALVAPSEVSYFVTGTKDLEYHSLSLDICKHYIDSELIEKLYREPYLYMETIDDEEYSDYVPKPVGESYFSNRMFNKHFPNVDKANLLKTETAVGSLTASCINVARMVGADNNYSVIDNHFKNNFRNLSLLNVAKGIELIGLTSRSFEGIDNISSYPVICYYESRLIIVYGIDSEFVYFHDPIYNFKRIDIDQPEAFVPTTKFDTTWQGARDLVPQFQELVVSLPDSYVV